MLVIVLLVAALLMLGSLWDQNVQKEHRIRQYQRELAKREKKIRELEDTIGNQRLLLDTYEDLIEWVQGADSTEMIATYNGSKGVPFYVKEFLK